MMSLLYSTLTPPCQRRWAKLTWLWLVNRSTRKLTLTAAGEKVLQKTRTLSQISQEIEGQSEKDLPSGTLRVACAHFTAMHLIAPVLPGLLLRYPQLRIELEHAQLGSVPTVANPIRYSQTPIKYKSAAPLLGQHTREVLKALAGIDGERYAQLAGKGVV